MIVFENRHCLHIDNNEIYCYNSGYQYKIDSEFKILELVEVNISVKLQCSPLETRCVKCQKENYCSFFGMLYVCNKLDIHPVCETPEIHNGQLLVIDNNLFYMSRYGQMLFMYTKHLGFAKYKQLRTLGTNNLVNTSGTKSYIISNNATLYAITENFNLHLVLENLNRPIFFCSSYILCENGLLVDINSTKKHWPTSFDRSQLQNALVVKTGWELNKQFLRGFPTLNQPPVSNNQITQEETTPLHSWQKVDSQSSSSVSGKCLEMTNDLKAVTPVSDEVLKRIEQKIDAVQTIVDEILTRMNTA